MAFAGKSKLARYRFVSIIGACALTWAAVVGVTGAQVLRHAWTPGESADAITSLPAEKRTQSDRPTLWFFVHPQCPCTEASENELRDLLERFPTQMNLTIAVFEPTVRDKSWDTNRVEALKSAFPGATIVNDREGMLSRQFGVRTSGHAMLFSTSGKCIFSGGLTLSRGHRGAGPGVIAIREFLETGIARCSVADTFGCAITGSNAEVK